MATLLVRTTARDARQHAGVLFGNNNNYEYLRNVVGGLEEIQLGNLVWEGCARTGRSSGMTKRSS